MELVFALCELYPLTMNSPPATLLYMSVSTVRATKKAAKAAAPSLINHIMTNKEYRGFYWFVGISFVIYFILFGFVVFLRILMNL